jgi:predicted site-specific integrase-resolvase
MIASELETKTSRLTPQQLADRWNISLHSLQRWRTNGIGPLFLKMRGTVAYRVEDVERYEQECLRISTSTNVCDGGAA